MKKSGKTTHDTENLRRKAENILAKKEINMISQLSESELQKRINEAHKLELELQNQELERLYSEAQDAINLYDFAPMGSYSLTRNGKIVRVNNNGVSILGKDLAHIINRSFSSFITKNSKPVFNQFLDTLFKNKLKSSCEVELSSDNNKPVFLHLSGNISENIEQCVIAVIDITERKQAEKNTAALALRNQTLLLTASDGIHVIDDRGHVVEANEAFCTMLGYTRDELLQLNVADWDMQWSGKDLLAKIQEFINNPGVFETRHRRKNGTYYDVEINGVGVTLEGRNYLYASARDITVRKLAEEKLQNNLSLTESTLESIHNGILVIDNSGKVIRTNERFSEMWHIPQDILSTRDDKILLDYIFDQLTDPDDFFAKVKELYSNPEAESLDLVYFKDGRIFERISKPMYIGSKPEGRVWSFLNITERKKAEEALSQTRINYETFFNTIDELLFVLDEQGNIIHCNKTVLDRLGYSDDELKGKSVLMVHPPERREEAGRIVTEMIEGKAEFCPIPIITKSGIQIPVETRVSSGYWNGDPVIFGVTKDISQLRLSEEKYSKLFFNNYSACGLDDFETGRYIEVNDAFCTLFGFTREEVIGKSALDLGILSPDSASELFKKVGKKNKVSSLECNLIAKNGDIKHVLLSGENIFIQNKKYRYTIVDDITERKQAEELLRQSEEKFRTVADYAYDWESWLGKDGRIIYISPSCERITGYKPEEFISDSLLLEKIVHPNDSKLLKDHLEAAHSSEHLHEIEEIDFRILKKDGSVVYIGHLCRPVFDDMGNYLGRRISNRDITERKLAEESLRESEEKYKTLFENTGTSIIIVEEDTTISLANKRFLKSTGYTKEEIEGVKKWTEIVYKDDLGWMSEQHRLRRENPQYPIPSSFEFRYNTKSGELRYVLINIDLIPGTKKSLASLVDITERKQTEKALVRSEELFRLFFSQSYMGFYFMMVDEPFVWDSTIDKKKTLETVFKEMKFTKVNQAFLDQYHAVQTDFIGKTLNDQFTDNPAHGRKVWAEFLDQGKNIRMQTNEFTIDGKPVIIEGDYICMYDEKDRVFGIFGVQMDITSRKMALAALHESETNLNAVFNATDESIFLLSADTTVLALNEEAARRIGVRSEDIIGHKVTELLPHQVVANRKPYIDRAISTGEQVHFEDERDGRWTSNHLYPITSPDGKVIRMAIFSRDITVRKHAEMIVRENVARYKILFEGANDGIIILDGDVISDCNQKAECIFKCKRADLLGHTILDFSPVEQPDGNSSALVVAKLKVALTLSGTPQFFEWTNLRPDGTLFNAEVSLNTFELSGRVYIQAIVRDITERKRAEEALLVSESKLRAVINNSSDAIGVHINGIWEMCNPAAFKLFGFADSKKLLGTSILKVIVPDERQRISDYVKNRMSDNKAPSVYVTRGLRNDGTDFDMDVTISSYTLENKMHVLVILRDITQRKKEEDALRESEERFRKMADTAPVMIWMSDTESMCNYVNKPWLDFTGRTLEQELDSGWVEGIHPDDFQRCQDVYLKNFNTRSKYTLEFRLRHADGGYRWLLENGVPRFTPNGIFVGYIGTDVDISEARRAQEILRESEERYKLITQNTLDIIFMFDKTGRQLFFNESVEKMLGYKREELIGKSFTHFVPKSEFPKYFLQLKNVFLNKEIINFITKIYHRNGNIIDVEINEKLVRYEGELVALGTIRDITERRKAELKIKQQNEELTKVNAEKDKFFSIIAHDLRGPIGGFVGLTERMAEGMVDMTLDELQNMARVMKKSSSNLYNLLSNLLEWSSMQRGLTSFEPVSFQLLPKIQDSLAVTIDAATKKEIGISITIAENLIIFADKNMLTSIIRNLVSNAVKFTPKGGNINISAASTTGKFITVSISDTGIGMNRNIVENLFNLDVNTSSKGTDGELSTGLGLMICKDFIEKQGGELWVESVEGKGSTFYFTIPSNND
jgi:PAS domain S-box-containing protein